MVSWLVPGVGLGPAQAAALRADGCCVYERFLSAHGLARAQAATPPRPPPPPTRRRLGIQLDGAAPEKAMNHCPRSSQVCIDRCRYYEIFM